jgi:thioredoxin-like negative regulator of GroEL
MHGARADMAPGRQDGAPVDGWWVVCLCAQWCGTCREYESVFDALGAAWPRVRFVWVDVEDEEDVVGDLDIETFPTILIADGRGARFFGSLLPQAQVLQRLLQSLQDDADTPLAGPQAQELFWRITASK